ncbi:MAG: dUTP diphosphatase, partial [Candidatus Rifleibacteriota bacterium]
MHNKSELKQKATIIKLLKTEEAKMPVRATPGSAGYDLCSTENIELLPGNYAMVPTGLRLEIPHGFEAQVRPRSGLAARHGIGVLNAPGTIDSDYRGEVKVILINHGQKPFTIEKGMRIAQMVFASITD